MFGCLKLLFRETERFVPPLRSKGLPECRIRVFKVGDYEACAAIYRLNEPGRFPPSYFNYFSERLLKGRDLFLVSEVAGQIRAFGGISMYKHSRMEIAGLNFGMVHPEFHKKGFGTALLFARIATLPPPDYKWVAHISTTGGSESFYKRFGFVWFQRFSDEHGNEFDEYRTRIRKSDWLVCREALAESSIVLDSAGAVIPTIGIHSNCDGQESL